MLKHVSEVLEAVGPEAITILDAIFEAAQFPEGVPAQRFRADHPQWFGAIDKLESNALFLERGRNDSACYRIKVFALPLISSDTANSLVRGFDEIWPTLQLLYKEHLSEPLSVQQIAKESQSEENWLKQLFTYMKDASGWWSGLSLDFPFKEDSTVCLSEGLLKHKAFSDLITQAYEWNYVNARNHAPAWNDFSQRVIESDGSGGFFSSADVAGRPEWYDDLDPTMKSVIDEVDRALRQGLLSLPTMGLRTLIDMTMADKGRATGSFAQRIQQFVDDGWVTRQHKELLEIVLDAGNASAHRAYFPDMEDLQTCVDVVKHLLQGIYVLRPKAERLKAHTPERKK
ncbi:hypothetical protein BI364_15830 [Acidihalobacter yilgarnensis]|uniref:DUF4145 domain-containing protein n=1 Tax=Acidihalobacter yilgarnensis TaxID=2819280 RepID=A0A1D8IS24_9GAMM|nr:DUF4145 domain-containing protein [Acidihalobacter yilgarnensis]AOU99207.1 hypothetical protein BI364_15830 [Acidihalobacter yilgarnensis]